MASTMPVDTVAGAPDISEDRVAASGVEESKPVEMSHLNTAIPSTPLSPGFDTFEDAVQQQVPTPTAETAASPADPASVSQSSEIKSTPHDTFTRKETEHLGPATEEPISPPQTSSGPILSISLMLTTGARHPYKIDEKYLRNRKVEAKTKEGEFDPRELSGYQLKELVWTDWRSEWEPRPASPSSIRLIVMGRMIEDKMMLKDFPFNLANTNVVHMTVKPADLIDDDEAAGGKGTGKGGALRTRDSEERGAGCRCVVQ